MDFPGPTEPDDSDRQERLGKQLRAILALMSDGERRTLEEISKTVEKYYGVRCPPASASAQLRHLRKPEYGGHVVLKEHIDRGLYVYWVRPPRKQMEMF